jgi:phosphoribosylanthranilate isomerase
VFHIKICGVRFDHDLVAVSQSAAGAVGLNFFPKSIRYLDPASPATAELSARARELGLTRIGVFVNDKADQIERAVEAVGLDHVQLHGDESVDLGRELVGRGVRVIRAVKLPTQPVRAEAIDDRTREWLDAGCGLLLDADSGASHGGSGEGLDWESIGRWASKNPHVPWVLAGGLTVDNVSEAIRASGAMAVDVASGVENPRGTKSRPLIDQFAQRATEALARR